jgi:hypothetical protein
MKHFGQKHKNIRACTFFQWISLDFRWNPTERSSFFKNKIQWMLCFSPFWPLEQKGLHHPLDFLRWIFVQWKYGPLLFLKVIKLKIN